jgi:hypothetical protein
MEKWQGRLKEKQKQREKWSTKKGRLEGSSTRVIILIKMG